MKKNLEIGKKLQMFFMIVILVFFITCIFLYFRRDRVVIATVEVDNIYNHHSYQVMNPFRDRASESVATAFLHELQKDCMGLLASIHETADRASDTCLREHAYPLRSWQLRARKNNGSSRVLLRYEVTRTSKNNPQGTASGPFWIWLDRGSNRWQVTGYERGIECSLHFFVAFAA